MSAGDSKCASGQDDHVYGLVAGSPQEFCNDEQPHDPHEFLVGPRRFQCPGLPFGGPDRKCASACEKAVALMESIDGPMTAPCPVCRGGWWFEDALCISGVHAAECPYSGQEPTREEALAYVR